MTRKAIDNALPLVLLVSLTAAIIGLQLAVSAIFGVSGAIILAVVCALAIISLTTQITIDALSGHRLVTFQRSKFPLIVGLLMITDLLIYLDLAPGWTIYPAALALIYGLFD